MERGEAEKVLCCALKGKSHLILMRVRGEMSFSILSYEAAPLLLFGGGVLVKKIMILNGKL